MVLYQSTLLGLHLDARLYQSNYKNKNCIFKSDLKKNLQCFVIVYAELDIKYLDENKLNRYIYELAHIVIDYWE